MANRLLGLVTLIWSAMILGPVHGGWIPEGSVDAMEIAGAPPDVDSAQQLEDLATVLWLQRTRTVADVVASRHDADWDLFVFAQWIGVPACQGGSARLQKVFTELSEEAEALAKPVKDKYKRERPYVFSDEVHPCAPLAKPGDYSFPSGHSLRGAMWGVLLGDIFPGEAIALKNAGLQVGYSRPLGGVHFPTDVEAGQRIGLAIADAVRETDAWKGAVEQIRGELGLLGETAAPEVTKSAAN